MDPVEKAIEAARNAQANAYCPYSKFRVGAAVKAIDEDAIFAGCNVENASYGGTICAERTAITAMVSALGARRIEFMVLVSDIAPPAAPCGLCRQVIAEFAGPDTPIIMVGKDGQRQDASFGDLLPRAFGPGDLV